MNVNFMTFGESDSRKWHLLTGDRSDRSGFIPLIIDNLFGELLTEKRLTIGSSSHKCQNGSAIWSLSMSMYEIHIEVLKDLLQKPGPDATNLELAYSAQDGAYIKGLSLVSVSSAAEATTVFRQGWARRTGAVSDYGPTSDHSSIITHFNLQVHLPNEPYPVRSWLKIVDLPGAEKLTENLLAGGVREKPLLNKSMLAFYQVMNELAGSPYPDRVINYSDSRLTQLLEEALGGNSKTRVICCLSPSLDSWHLATMLKMCIALSQVKNFPVVNSYCMESLLTQYRAKLLSLKHRPYEHMDPRSGVESESMSALQEQVQRLTHENVQLQDRNERLYAKLGELQEKMGKLAGSKTDLSSRLVFNEEEKLKISKDLIDLQIETNKMREQYEAENFELKNLVAKNETLSLELLNLASARNNLPQPQNNYSSSRATAHETSAELERVRAMVHHLSACKVKPEDVVASEYERRKLERNLLGNQDHIKAEIEKMKKTYDSQQQKLEDRVIAMGKELQEAKKAIRNTQHKLAEQSAVLLTSQSQLQEVEAENSRLQLQLKELNEEYRSRLTQYIKDLVEYVDSKSKASKGPGKAPADHAHMKPFVDSMLKDIRASHKSREEQLAGAARGYKKRMQNLVKKHENLLIAYRMQREQIQSLGSRELDPGPPEFHFIITDTELLTGTMQELNRLREDKEKLEIQLHELQEKKRLSETSGLGLSPQHKLDEEGWAEIRKQLREFTHTTQEELEKERSQLLTRAIVAEEQVLELQEYVDKHLARYKQEILRLRKLLGNDAPRAFSAGASDVPLMQRPQKTISHEL
ncbi:coiled-coil domain-containing protein 78 isoform X3 [Alligator mississippiensis]|uniref:coiled-coil domain-containing protein 78 isoform X3 n=1 Tax=Alligator mississippiensis TaxID=8496 RepID=UPI0009073E6D|nr:coiled-coil domain-containing protein 78 isoform X3 [Alligator mississippiensis]